MGEQVIIETNLEGFNLLRRGKVRDIYDLGESLLIVSSDRISAFDSILGSGIPKKGKVLTALSEFWFGLTKDITPSHLITTDLREMDEGLLKYADILEGRSMLVRKTEVIPIECVARGYLAGSAWREYQEGGAVCGIALPDGLQLADKLPELIFTPATKSESGHDINITIEQAGEIVGADVAEHIKAKTLEVYQTASDYALTKGIIISDTKFEWGQVGGEILLIDEVLTPDSSRFWPQETYEPGKQPPSFDKQFVRDYLETSGWDKEPPAPALPDEIIEKTTEKYLEALKKLTGRDLS